MSSCYPQKVKASPGKSLLWLLLSSVGCALCVLIVITRPRAITLSFIKGPRVGQGGSLGTTYDFKSEFVLDDFYEWRGDVATVISEANWELTGQGFVYGGPSRLKGESAFWENPEEGVSVEVHLGRERDDEEHPDPSFVSVTVGRLQRKDTWWQRFLKALHLR